MVINFSYIHGTLSIQIHYEYAPIISTPTTTICDFGITDETVSYKCSHIFSHGTLKIVFVHENEFPCLLQELLHMYYFVLRISIVLLIPSRKLYKGTKPKDKSL